MEFGPSALEERRRFYEREFSIKKVKRWFFRNEMKLPQLCAVDAGTETGVIINKKLKGQMLYFPFKNLIRKIKKYVPEDVYYDRSEYENPDRVLKELKFNKFISQELVFDIDSDNIVCDCHDQESKVCNFCLNQTFFWARKMKKELEKEFKKIRIVYSGRGFHVHVLDRKAFLLSINERKNLNKKFAKYPIDPWVSRGYISLIRMPYSLNGLVSRKVIPIKNSLIFNKKETYPKFLFS